MDTFIQSELIVQEEPYRNELDLRLHTGKIIHIFYTRPRDERQEGTPDRLDELLETNWWYKLLIIVRVDRVIYSPIRLSNYSTDLAITEFKLPSGKLVERNDLVQGQIVDLSWDAASLILQAIATPRIYKQRYVLLETSIGKIIMSHKALQENLEIPIEQLTVGGYLEWEPARLDLLAIIEKFHEQGNTHDIAFDIIIG